MDPVLNSNAQSPLVRTLNSIATKSESLVYNIPDNQPPMSFKKVVVPAYSGSALGDTFRFKIPQFGFLQKVVVRLQLTVAPGTENLGFGGSSLANGTWGIQPMVGVVQRNIQGGNNPERLYNYMEGGCHPQEMLPLRLLETATLETHNRKLQTVYSDALEVRLWNMDEKASYRERRAIAGAIIQGGTNLAPVPGSPAPPANLGGSCFFGARYAAPNWKGRVVPDIVIQDNPTIVQQINLSYVNEAGPFVGTSEHFIELPFAVCQAPHLNLQTRFVEDLEVAVQTRTPGYICGLAAAAANLTGFAQLVLYYRNVHENVDQMIRNENFSNGVPASLLLWDTYAETPVHTAWSDATAQGTSSIQVPLRSPNCAFAFSIIFSMLRSTAVVSQTTYSATARAFWNHPTRCGFKSCRLVASGQVLWSSGPLEMKTLDWQNYQLATRRENALDPLSSGGGDRNTDSFNNALGTFITVGGTPDTMAHPNITHYNPGVNDSYWSCYYLAPTLQHNELVNIASTPLQTLNNPYLEFELVMPQTVSAVTQYGTLGIEGISVFVYTHYRHITRIDSDTGVITRSVDV